MATINNVPAGHRATAALVPPDVLDSLPPEELRLRVKHAHRIREAAPATGEFRAAMLAHAAALLDAMPVGRFIEERKRLTMLAHDASPKLDPVTMTSQRGAYTGAISDLNREHKFPRGLVEAAEQFLLGQGAALHDGYDLAAILGQDQDQADKSVATADKSITTYDMLTKRTNRA